MDNYQFARLEWASKVGSTKRQKGSRGNKGNERRWSAGEVLREAARCKGHCAHVRHPQPPTTLYGVDPLDVEAIAQAWADSVTQKNGRPLRRDSPILACGVISLPRHRIDDWPQFREVAVEVLVELFGPRLRSVVEHLDEENPHLHLYAVPEIGDEDFGTVHPGYAASRAARHSGEMDKRTAYTAAMRRWQDVLHEKLGSRFGLARLGPQRTRLSRSEWKLRQLEQELAATQARVDTAKEELDNAEREATARVRRISEQVQLAVEWKRRQAEQQAATVRKAADENAAIQYAELTRLRATLDEDRARIETVLMLMERDPIQEAQWLQQQDALQRQLKKSQQDLKRMEKRLTAESDAKQDALATVELGQGTLNLAMSLLNKAVSRLQEFEDTPLRYQLASLKGLLLKKDAGEPSR
ncbi:plasmid recombination protein [Noviherbaspirillum malthae]|uniref:plasmid recombination protein n=1 Tax=Noviherbaspirillum malthae TaxID=1260987 RepID=UPI0018906BBC|nr:plasmid recombination protein [Noviherbaspirillum malthae]